MEAIPHEESLPLARRKDHRTPRWGRILYTRAHENLFPPLPSGAFDFFLSITQPCCSLSRGSARSRMRYYRHDLDRISAASLFAALSSPSNPLSAPLFSHPSPRRQRGLKIGTEPTLKATSCESTGPRRLGGSGSNESMKNNTCPGPAAKIVNAPRYIRRQKGAG